DGDDRQSRPDLDFARDRREETDVGARLPVLGSVGRMVPLVRGSRVRELFRLDVDRRVRKRRRRAAILPAGGAAGVVEVQVRQHQRVHVPGTDAFLREAAFDRPRAVDRIDLPEFRVPFLAQAALDERRVTASPDEEAIRREPDAVSFVRRKIFLPQDYRRDAETRSTVQSDAGCSDDDTYVTTTARIAKCCSKRSIPSLSSAPTRTPITRGACRRGPPPPYTGRRSRTL